MQQNHAKKGAKYESQDFKTNKDAANKRMHNLELFEGSKGAHLLNRTDEDQAQVEVVDHEPHTLHVSVQSSSMIQ